MVAGVWTDLVQGVIMLVAAVGIWLVAMSVGGGFGAIVETISASEAFGPSFLDPLGRQSAVAAASLFLVFSVGSLGQPHMLHKFMMIRDVGRLRWMPLVLGVSQTLCLLVWLGIGLVVPALVGSGVMAPPAGPDEVAPAFLLEYAPPALAGLALAGVLVRDLPRAFRRRPARGLTLPRVAVGVVAIASGLLAVSYGDLIALLGTFAFGTFAASLAPALAVGLNWERVTATAASASILTGMVVAVGLELVSRAGGGLSAVLPVPVGLLPSVVALIASLSVLFGVSFASPRRVERDPLVDLVLSA
jgi:Na+/proline symporter